LSPQAQDLEQAATAHAWRIGLVLTGAFERS
jgi:hypothetical protein